MHVPYSMYHALLASITNVRWLVIDTSWWHLPGSAGLRWSAAARTCLAWACWQLGMGWGTGLGWPSLPPLLYCLHAGSLVAALQHERHAAKYQSLAAPLPGHGAPPGFRRAPAYVWVHPEAVRLLVECNCGGHGCIPPARRPSTYTPGSQCP